ncbi:MAG: hypothetical protein HYZ53_22915 [Planctomycetes bacterium]|nr:hypothetical protein [Planctomycetota bacterium]
MPADTVWRVRAGSLAEGLRLGYADPAFDDSAWDPAPLPFEFQLHGMPGRGWFRGRLPGPHRLTGLDTLAVVFVEGRERARLAGPYDACIAEGHVAIHVEEEGERRDWVTSLLRPIAQSDIYGWKRTIRGVHGNWDCKRDDLRSGGWWRAPTPEPRVRVLARGQSLVVRGGGELRVRAGGVERRGHGEVRLDLGVAPRAWSTWDRAGPHLVPVEVNGVLHEVGFRTLSVSLTPTLRDVAADFLSYLGALAFGRGMPDIGHSAEFWRFRLNGEDLFLRGTNYVSDLHPERVRDFEREAALLREANLNLVRVHGHVEPPAFYHACSRAGILVMQDLPLQWGYAPSVRASALRVTRNVVEELREETCLAIWNAHNEPMPWDLLGVDRSLVSLIRRLDPGRPVLAGTAYPGVTMHAYAGWYFGDARNFRYAAPAACTELGSQSLPVEGEEAACAQVELLRRHLGAWSDLEDLRARSQEYQAIVTQIGVEHFRRRKPDCRAMVHFLFADANPAVSWSVLDFERRKKPAFAALARSMSPLLASLERYEGRARAGERIGGGVFLVNDLGRAVDVSVRVGTRGSVVEFAGSADPERAVRIGEAWFVAGPPGLQVVELEVRGAGGEALARNEAWWRVEGGRGRMRGDEGG